MSNISSMISVRYEKSFIQREAKVPSKKRSIRTSELYLKSNFVRGGSTKRMRCLLEMSSRYAVDSKVISVVSISSPPLLDDRSRPRSSSSCLVELLLSKSFIAAYRDDNEISYLINPSLELLRRRVAQLNPANSNKQSLTRIFHQHPHRILSFVVSIRCFEAFC
jgi:hypothetical protein